MTRLFIRFYVGVLLILLVAWYVQSFVFQDRNVAENVRAIESALGGGVRLARSELAAASADDRENAVARLQRHFDYPVSILAAEDVPEYARGRFADGDEAVFVRHENRSFILTPIENSQDALIFGELPEFVGPSQTEVMVGLGAVLVLAAGGIAFLLRPVVAQIRLVERAARAIADGDLSARVDERKVKAARTLARAFNDMAGRTETMVRTQRELLQAVSHELRTPLARICFAIDLVREAKTEEQRNLRLSSVEAASEELDELVGELLRYVRMETVEPRLNIEAIELRPVVDDLIEKHSVGHPSIEFSVAEGLHSADSAVQADRLGFNRALGNVLGNAARFAKHRVVVNAVSADDGIRIDVDDDGPGIAEADRKRVFDPFVRLDESSRGAGLGLALVRRIVGHHGGSVVAETSPLGGCRIRTFWPCAPEKRNAETIALPDDASAKSTVDR